MKKILSVFLGLFLAASIYAVVAVGKGRYYKGVSVSLPTGTYQVVVTTNPVSGVGAIIDEEFQLTDGTSVYMNVIIHGTVE